MRSNLGRSNGRRVGAKRSSLRERITPLVLAYVEANPRCKRGAVADLFGTNGKMIHRILTDAGRPTFARKKPKQLDLFKRGNK